MPNPYLPSWAYIPDGEPRVFGDRVYIFGSHDNAGNSEFCDWKLLCWSAPLSNLNAWVCHGDIFHTLPDRDHPSDTNWTNDSMRLFAPDVVQGKDGKYYLFAYIVNSRGCVAVADRPEGPYKLLGQYEYDIPNEVCSYGAFVDPGVLVDDDGRTYIYCGYQHSFMAEVNSDKMYEIIPGSYIEHIIPCKEETEHGFDTHDKLFFEACSPRKVGDTYYLIYSPLKCPCLAYATSKSPMGPFEYRGVIVDSGNDYPGGNNHGSIMKVGDQWYIFYHRMTNNSIMSRRGCVEKIEILPDGTIPQVETTSLGFSEYLNPFEVTKADLACVLKGTGFITEKNVFTRVVTNITETTVLGYKYFEFGTDDSSKTMEFAAKVNGMGMNCHLHILVDGEDGEEIGCVDIGHDGGVVKGIVKAVTGRHSVFFKITTDYTGWTKGYFDNRCLFELEEFVFLK